MKHRSKIIALLLSVAMLFTVFAFTGCSNTNTSVTDNTVTENTAPVTDESGNEMVSGNVYAMSKSMTFSSPTLLSSTASSGITISCQVYPFTASNKAVDWSVAWDNPSSSFASGKSASTYLTVTPTSDGSTTANIVCNAAFGEPINITVTSRDNPDVTATCKVDYQKRLSGYSTTIFGQSASVSAGGTSSINISSSDTTALGSLPLSSTFTVGTVDGDTADLGCFLAFDVAGLASKIEDYYWNTKRATLGAAFQLTIDGNIDEHIDNCTQMVVAMAQKPSGTTFKEAITPFVQLAVLTTCTDYFSELLTQYPIALLRVGIDGDESTYGDIEIYVTDGVLQLALSDENVII